MVRTEQRSSDVSQIMAEAPARRLLRWRAAPIPRPAHMQEDRATAALVRLRPSCSAAALRWRAATWRRLGAPSPTRLGASLPAWLGCMHAPRRRPLPRRQPRTPRKGGLRRRAAALATLLQAQRAGRSVDTPLRAALREVDAPTPSGCACVPARTWSTACWSPPRYAGLLRGRALGHFLVLIFVFVVVILLAFETTIRRARASVIPYYKELHTAATADSGGSMGPQTGTAWRMPPGMPSAISALRACGP